MLQCGPEPGEHGEIFAEIRPAATLVEVSGLLGDGTVIEIEAVAVVDRPPST